MLNWKTHARVNFHMDDRHPVGASQHQKVVVIDDRIAFCGGLDLSKWRWDTPAHTINEPRRVDPDGKPYPPFHDIQMLVDGDAAAALGELARERWRCATGDDIAVTVSNDPQHDPWPDSLQPIIRDVPVGIARTRAEYREQSSVREVEQLYLDSIAAAQHFIYIENQYLTANCVQRALVECLQREHGPEVVIVMPQKTGGWLEQHTMDVLRARLVKQLYDADHADRLRLYYPQLAPDTDISLMVHAKFMVVDDRLLRVASSNLSNRSMGLDSECDLAIEVDEGCVTQDAIRNLRLSLICEHLGIEIDTLHNSEQEHNSLIRAIEAHRGGERTLQRLHTEVDRDVDQLVPESALIDPERPIDSHRFVNHFVPDEDKPHTAKHVLLGGTLLAVLLALIAAWHWTPLGDWLNIDILMRHAESLQAHPATPLLVISLFALAGSLAIPLTLLVVTAVLVFGSLLGFAYALAGAELSALLSYMIGQSMGRDLVRRYAGKRLNRISKKLSQRGVLTIITLRIVPVAPFAVINLVAGASHIHLRDFALGSLIGLLPGVSAISLFADSVVRSLRHPDGGNLAWLLMVMVAIVAIVFGLRKWLSGKSQNADGERADDD
jgi:phosphatidylserine/phosphatidylglycerophosphate/cardiolipin synthase-like enzyme/uncharacterized membrane protein YdjX (TVP38/TMEM64 family)